MQLTERDLLVQIDTKLDVYKQKLEEHISVDNKHFDSIFGRLRTTDKFIGGLVALNAIVILAFKFWK